MEIAVLANALGAMVMSKDEDFLDCCSAESSRPAWYGCAAAMPMPGVNGRPSNRVCQGLSA